jgi:hypothetical protein
MKFLFFKKNPFIFWLLSGTCCKNLAIFLKNSEIDKLEPFFPTKILCIPLRGHYISQVGKMPKKISKIKTTLLHSLQKNSSSRSLKHAKVKEPLRMAGLGFIQNLLITGLQWMIIHR